jgi:hypothetical protein
MASGRPAPHAHFYIMHITHNDTNTFRHSLSNPCERIGEGQRSKMSRRGRDFVNGGGKAGANSTKEMGGAGCSSPPMLLSAHICMHTGRKEGGGGVVK